MLPHEPMGRIDFGNHEVHLELSAIRNGHHVMPEPRRSYYHVTELCGEAGKAPPIRDVLGYSHHLPHERAGSVEGAAHDDNHIANRDVRQNIHVDPPGGSIWPSRPFC